MRRLLRIFRIRRDERGLALAVLLLVAGVNVLAGQRYWPLFSVWHEGAFGVFPSHYHVSGFDALMYSIGSHWGGFFTLTFRHPLLSLLLLPTWAATQLLHLLTGRNCVQLVLGAQEVFFAVYAMLLLYRVLRHVVGAGPWPSRVLTLLTLSFGMVWLSTAVPDHFIYSLFLILLSLLTAGLLMRRRRPMATGATALLLFLTAGVTLTNGAKVLLAQLFANGRRFFRPRNLLLGAVVPLALLFAVGKAQYKLVVQPGERARLEARKARSRASEPSKPNRPNRPNRPNGQNGPNGQQKPASPTLLAQWSDAATPRWPSLRDNLLGETIQLHEAHLLQDVGMGRPVFVGYGHWWNDAVEWLIAALTVAGIVAGRRSRFLWLCLCCVATDAIIHFGFGFGLNEVYIMACHWVFIIPVAIACLFRAMEKKATARAARSLLLAVTALLTLYLFAWNGRLLLRYFLPG